MNYFFRTRRTNRPTHTPTVMYSNLWGGNSRSVREYVQSLVLHRNSPPPLCSRLRPLFSSSVLFGAETAQIMHTHTPCNAIVKFRLDAYFDHFAPCAPKQDRKMGVDEKRIFCYLPHITAFCVVLPLHLISIRQYTQSTVEKIRLFSYFPNPVALLKNGRAASLSHPILASQYTHSHYHTAPHLRNYSSRFRQLIRANQDLLLGLSVGRVTEYGGTTPPVEGTNCAKTR